MCLDDCTGRGLTLVAVPPPTRFVLFEGCGAGRIELEVIGGWAGFIDSQWDKAGLNFGAGARILFFSGF
jgi:hypothetical protein